MAEKANEFMKTWGGVVAGLLNFALGVVLVGFGTWTVREINALKIQMSDNAAWHATHLQIVEKEKENLKLSIMSDVKELIRSSMDRLTQDVRTMDLAQRDTAAKVNAMNDAITTMASRFASLTADVRQALINSDFQRNAETKKGN